MIALLISIPIFGILLMLQTAIFSRIPLLQGTTDLVLLALVAWALQKKVNTAWQWGIIGGVMVSFVSALPLGTPILAYMIAVALTLALRQRVWQVPMLAMFVATFASTLLSQAVDLFVLRLTGDQLPPLQVLNMITLPSILLNLLLAIPVYALIGDLASWLYPEEIEV
jgi:rod shape-determining protein MreD